MLHKVPVPLEQFFFLVICSFFLKEYNRECIHKEDTV